MGKEELYDWQADPGELRNLAETPEGREVMGQLKDALAARINSPRVPTQVAGK